MGFYGSTIQEMAANKLSQPYYRFDGSTAHNHISVADNDKMDLAFGDFSFECMYMPKESGRVQRLIKQYDATGWLIEQDTNDKLNFWHRSASSPVLSGDATSTGALTMGKWYHIVVTIDRDGVASFYFNGVLDSTDTISGGMSARTMTQTNPLLLFGETDQNPVQGQANIARLWNKILTAAEVKELYSGISVPFEYKGATSANFMTVANAASPTNESNSTGHWWGRNGATVTSDSTTWSGSHGSYSIKTVTTGGNQGVWGNQTGYYAHSALANYTLTIGKKYRLTYTVKQTVGTGTAEAWTKDGGTRHDSTAFSTSNGGITTVTKDFIAEGTSLYFAIIGSSGATFYMDNWKVIQLGAVGEWDGSGMTGTKWHDKSGNNLDGTVSGASLTNQSRVLGLAGSNTSTSMTSDNAGSEIKLRNTSDTDNNYSAITFQDAVDGTPISRIVFKADDHSSNKGSIEMYTANGSGLVQHLKLGNDGATTISGNVIIPTLNTGAAIGTVDYGGDAKAHANAFYTASGGGEFALAIRNDNQAGNGLFIRAGNDANYTPLMITAYDEGHKLFAINGTGSVVIGENSSGNAERMDANSALTVWGLTNAGEKHNNYWFYSDSNSNLFVRSDGAGSARLFLDAFESGGEYGEIHFRSDSAGYSSPTTRGKIYADSSSQMHFTTSSKYIFGGDIVSQGEFVQFGSTDADTRIIFSSKSGVYSSGSSNAWHNLRGHGSGVILNAGSVTDTITFEFAGNPKYSWKTSSNAGAKSYQTVTGSKTCTQGAWTEIAYISHTYVLEVMAWATTGGNRNRMVIYDLIGSYGGGVTATRRMNSGYGPSTPTVDDLQFQYLNSGGSQNYILRAYVETSDNSTNPTVYYTIRGMADGTISNI